MEQLTLFIQNFIELSAEASPWLLLGLVIAGLMKAWLPNKLLSKHLGQGTTAITKAAFIGAPLPLCSCGVIPVATELRRGGASAAATSSFLVATPETGVDSVSVSYALLGPIFAIYRPFAAIISAIFTGLLVSTVPEKKANNTTSQHTSCCSSKKATEALNKPEPKACCSSENKTVLAPKTTQKSCCSSKSEALNCSTQETKTCCNSDNTSTAQKRSFMNKTKQGVHYASTQLIDDIILWLLVGLIFASIVRTFLPESFLISYGSGLPAMLLMILISIPMYICATASTPIAAGFIMAGLSPGTALVFMMAGPATNISTLGVIRNEMGSKVLIRYLLGVALSAIIFGLLLDFSLNLFAVNITDQMQHSHELLPQWFGLGCAGLILFLSIKPLRRFIVK